MEILLILDHATFQDDYLSVAKECAPYCDMIRYRAKDLTVAQVYENAAKLRDELPDSRLILSEYADMAYALGYDGVNIGEHSMPADVVKRTFPTLQLGYSAHTMDECSLPADYFTLSPVFYTPKPYEVIPLGAVEAPGRNVFALGGINTDNISQLKGLGYRGVAGISFYKDIKKIRKLTEL